MKSESEKDPLQRQRLVLRNLLKKHFDEQDLQDLCFDLEVDYENLANSQRKDSKIRELILYMEKRLLLADLVKVARSHRPEVNWPSFPEQTKSVSYSPVDGLISSGYSPVPTGFTDLDRLLGGGLFNSCLHAIAGRPGMGRSSFALSTALVSARRYGKIVVYFSFKLPVDSIYAHFLAYTSGASIYEIEYQLTVERASSNQYEEAMARLHDIPIIIVAKPFLSLKDIRDECERIAVKSGLGLIVVDGLEYITPEYSSSSIMNEIPISARWLRNLAQAFDVPTLVTMNVSRHVDGRQNKQPTIKDLPDLTVEMIDFLILLYRDEYYYLSDTSRPNIAELYIAKSRFGPTGTVDLFWHKSHKQFRNLVRTELIDL